MSVNLDAWVPRAVLALQQPAPASVIPIKQPHRLTKACGEVGGGSVYRNHQIQVHNQRGGVREIFEFNDVVVYDWSVPAADDGVPELGLGGLAFLQADEFHVDA